MEMVIYRGEMFIYWKEETVREKKFEKFEYMEEE